MAAALLIADLALLSILLTDLLKMFVQLSSCDVSLNCSSTAFKCTGKEAKGSLKWQYYTNQEVSMQRLVL